MKLVNIEYKLELISRLKEQMYYMACCIYNKDKYSSENYTGNIDTHCMAVSALVDLCNDLNIDVSHLKVTYFNVEVDIHGSI